MIALIYLGCLLGWWYAHATIAHECRRLGRFYVGDTVFVCRAETDTDQIGAEETPRSGPSE